jgi:hypothetical protein
MHVSGNAFYDGAWKYASAGAAALYRLQDNTHKWYTAPSGTAGNAITFTQAMTLDASGNLGVRTTTPSFRVSVEADKNAADGILATNVNTGASAFGFVGASSAVGNLEIRAYSAAHGVWPNTALLAATGSSFTGGLVVLVGGANPISFWNNSTERARIDASGNLGVGVSSSIGARLHVRDTNNPQVWVENTGGATAQIRFLNTTSSTGYVSYIGSTLSFATANTERMALDGLGNVIAGGSAALATTATDGFLYVPTCAGTPTGTPTAITGMAPIVVDTTNHKLYFRSGGVWRDAGP